MNGLFPSLIAQGGGDIVGVIIFVIVMVISVLGHLINKVQEVNREAARRGRPGAAPGAPLRRDPLADEISEFLQQTAQRRGALREGAPAGAAPSPQAPAPSAAPATPLTASPPRQPRVRPAASGPGVTGLEPPPSQPAGALSSPSGARVAEHVRSYLDTGDIVQETAGLGRDVAMADQKTEQRLREAFTHRLGQLAAAPTEAPATLAAPKPQPGAAARGLAAMLRNPTSVRQAILLSEILNPPEHRWS
jgi:hypothetical protein